MAGDVGEGPPEKQVAAWWHQPGHMGEAGALSPAGVMVTHSLCTTQGSGMTPLRALTQTHPKDIFLHPESVHQPRGMGTTTLLSV